MAQVCGMAGQAPDIGGMYFGGLRAQKKDAVECRVRD
jgi:hypothetical protein